jgi:NitT/TauT family transport system substrate-binding protein
MKNRSIVRRSQAILALTALCSLALPSAVQAEDQKLVIGIPAEPSLTYAPHYMAKGAGFFKEEGLDVDIVSFDGSGTLIPQLSSKRVLVGWAAPDVVIVTPQPGRDPLPLRFFYNGSRISPWEFVVPANSDIKTLTDLRGKNIGVGSLSFGNIPITKAIFKQLKMEAGRDYKLVPVGAGAAAFQAFNSGQIDALNVYDAAHANLELTGAKIRRLPIPAEFTNVTAHGFLAHEDTIKTQGKMLAGVGRAFAKATIVCDVAPRACVENFWRMFPNMKPTKGTEEQKMADAIMVLKAGMHKYLAFSGGTREWGSYTDAGLKNLVTALYDGGQIATDKVDVGAIYTNALVREMNNFSAKAVATAARKLP